MEYLEVLRKTLKDRFVITYQDDEYEEQIFCYSVTPGVAVRLVVTRKTYIDGDIRYEVEVHSSIDEIHWAYNFCIDKVICINEGFIKDDKIIWKKWDAK